jgi:hypothetical protein
MSIAWVLVLVAVSQPVSAQSNETRFQLGAGLTTVNPGEFDRTDVGVSVSFSWRLTALMGAEAEFGFYPADFPDAPAFSRSRVEGLFGMTVGPRIGVVRPFAKVRPGFVTFSEGPQPLACVAIFPPPLSCRLASGDTRFALDVGGGVELFPSRRTFVRVDVSDRLIRYPGTVRDRHFKIQEHAFFSHDFRFTIGGGLRF